MTLDEPYHWNGAADPKSPRLGGTEPGAKVALDGRGSHPHDETNTSGKSLNPGYPRGQPCVTAGSSRRPVALPKAVAPGTQIVVQRLVLPEGESLGGKGLAFRMPMPEVILALTGNASTILDHDHPLQTQVCLEKKCPDPTRKTANGFSGSIDGRVTSLGWKGDTTARLIHVTARC